MTKEQIQACLTFSEGTLSEAESTLHRIQAEPYPKNPYWNERLNAARRLVYEIKAHRCRLQEQLAAL